MTDLKNKKFVLSYSGGKDSTLSLYRAINLGMIPLELITTYNTDENRSWFHAIPEHLFQQVDIKTNIPVSFIETTGELYTENFEKKLTEAKNKGAEYCVFGDIDVEGHLKWGTDICNKVGLKAFFPLWNENREKVVYEFIDSNFKSIITVVDTRKLPSTLLGKVLSREVIDEIKSYGADACGENGEYHTFAYDGPLFSSRVCFSKKEIVHYENYSTLLLE